MSAQLTFPGVTPAQYEALKAAAAKNGITITGVTGTVESRGCTISYAYAGWPGCTSAPLSLTLVHAPMFCGGMALGKLHDLVQEVLDQTTAPADPAESSAPV